MSANGKAVTMRIHAPAIRYFDAVRKAGSIREAARRLNVASSAVNRQILKLEAEIGMPLFERLPGGLKLSSAGEVLTRHVAIVLRDADRTKSELAALKGANIGRVEVVAVEGLSSDFLPSVIGTLLADHSRVRVKVTTAGSFAIPSAIINGDADLGIAFSLPRNPELHQLAVGRFRLGAVVPPTHPLAARKHVRIGDCADYPMVMSDAQLSIRSLLHPTIVHSGRPITPAIEANSIELMKNLAEHDLGVTFMSRIGLEKELRAGTLVHIPLEDRGPVFTELGLYVRANASLPVAVDAFAQIAVAEIQRRAQEE